LVSSSKNGFGRPSPRNHQPRSVGTRKATRPSERGGGARRERTDGGVLEDSAKRGTEHVISGTASIVSHERMNDADHRKAWTGSVADRGPAAISVPSENPVGELQAAHGVRACSKPHAACWHMEDVRSARCIEHVRPLEEMGKRLTVLAVADETETSMWRNVVRDSAHVAAAAAKREILRVLSWQCDLHGCTRSFAWSAPVFGVTPCARSIRLKLPREGTMTASAMPADQFWQIIERAARSGYDQDDHMEALRLVLHELSRRSLGQPLMMGSSR
jgi:hypothetical protein